jgi:adenylate cyclase
VGEERLLAILFSDIRDFTAFSEAHLPYDVIHALNRYFTRVGAIISRHHGQIDNFLGDGIMALFGVDDPANAVLNAVQAGLEMLQAVQDMQPYFQAQFHTNLRIGVGLHYGEAVLGAIGSGDRRRLTAIGDAVNVASRVESANKEAGTSFLISQRAYQQVGGLVVCDRTVDLALKGKSGLFHLYEVTGLAPEPVAAISATEYTVPMAGQSAGADAG